MGSNHSKMERLMEMECDQSEKTEIPLSDRDKTTEQATGAGDGDPGINCGKAQNMETDQTPPLSAEPQNNHPWQTEQQMEQPMSPPEQLHNDEQVTSEGQALSDENSGQAEQRQPDEPQSQQSEPIENDHEGPSSSSGKDEDEQDGPSNKDEGQPQIEIKLVERYVIPARKNGTSPEMNGEQGARWGSNKAVRPSSLDLPDGSRQKQLPIDPPNHPSTHRKTPEKNMLINIPQKPAKSLSISHEAADIGK